MKSSRVAPLATLAILFVAVFPVFLSGQDANTPSHDLDSVMKIFSNYSKDFRAVEQPLHGDELSEVEFLDGVASTAEDRLFAANTMLGMYDAVSCKPDRVKLNPILKKQLDYYSWQMDNEANRTAGSLQFAKTPAVAQMGLRMKDDLRAAKARLDTIAASLDR
jgi:hypothetical protein